jgi:hypothetical protein
VQKPPPLLVGGGASVSVVAAQAGIVGVSPICAGRSETADARFAAGADREDRLDPRAAGPRWNDIGIQMRFFISVRPDRMALAEQMAPRSVCRPKGAGVGAALVGNEDEIIDQLHRQQT